MHQLLLKERNPDGVPTLRGIDEQAAAALKKRAQKEGTSVNAVTPRLHRIVKRRQPRAQCQNPFGLKSYRHQFCLSSLLQKYIQYFECTQQGSKKRRASRATN
jgi:hypothetical protein